jgi:hypothetical protein
MNPDLITLRDDAGNVVAQAKGDFVRFHAAAQCRRASPRAAILKIDTRESLRLVPLQGRSFR